MTNLDKALKRLKMQKVLPAFYNKVKKGIATLYIGGIGYWVEDEHDEEHKKLLEKKKELESKGDYIVYGIMRYAIEGTHCYAFLLVGNEDNDLPYTNGKWVESFAYVLNEAVPEYSEYGYVSTCGMFGGLAIGV